VPEPLLLAVAGPTGSGKSALAIAVAAHLDGEIVNCDSIQVYRGFDIGAAKLGPEEWQGIPHHLLDVLAAHEISTAGDYARRARVAIAEISRRGKLPVVAGGTGFYLRALLDGLFAGPGRDAELRERLYARERRRAGSLHRLLARLDADSAARIHPNDVKKVVRALEVSLLARRPLSRMLAEGRGALEGYRVVKIGLNPPRERLYDRLNARVGRMFEEGLLDEVRNLLAGGVSPEAKPFESIGYSQALQCVRGELSRDEAIESTRIATRQYAKRQLTWFRREQNIYWINDFGESPASLAESIRYC
jgi:tRNA dimethylallyltransferase